MQIKGSLHCNVTTFTNFLSFKGRQNTGNLHHTLVKRRKKVYLQTVKLKSRKCESITFYMVYIYIHGVTKKIKIPQTVHFKNIL